MTEYRKSLARAIVGGLRASSTAGWVRSLRSTALLPGRKKESKGSAMHETRPSASLAAEE